MENSKNNTPEAFKMQGDWSKQSKDLKQKYSQLTDGDLKYEKGKENDLLKRVQSRLNKSHEEVVDIFKKVQTQIA